MRHVRYAQLVYTRVEPDYSPQYKSGYQTVYRSASLSDSEVAFIEKRIQCFQPAEENAVRHQFFALGNGAIVLSHTTGIRTHPEINDKTRREGVFIAHCLILARADFEKVDYNPFVILDRFTFLGDPEEMVEKFPDPKESIPLAEFEIRRMDGHGTSAWTGAEAQKLVALAMQADEIVKKGRAVHLIGSSDEVEEALRTTFTLMPLRKRLSCAFDTIADNCMIQQGAYWAIGLSRSGSAGAFAEINARGRSVKGAVQFRFDEKDLYSGWLQGLATQAELGNALQYAGTFQKLAAALDEHSPALFDELDADACAAFIDLYGERVAREYETKTAKLTGDEIARRLYAHLQEILGPLDLLRETLTFQADPAQLSSRVLDWIVSSKPELNEGDWRWLEHLARQAENARLLFLSATCGKKVNGKTRDEALSRFTPEDFQFVLKFLMGPIAPANYVTLDYFDQLVQDKRLAEMTPTQAVELIDALFKINAMTQLDLLAPFVRDLDNDQLHQVEQQLQKRAGIGERFLRAVQARRNELGAPPTTWFGVLKF